MSPQRSPVISTIAQLTLYVIKLLALWLFLRGHQQPGGGFVAGLVVAAAIALQGLAFGLTAARAIFPFPFWALLGGGLLLALSTAVWPMLLGRPFLDLTFDYYYLPFFGKIELASAAVFDVGVFLVVVGAAKSILLHIAEEKSQDVEQPGEAEEGARSGATAEL